MATLTYFKCMACGAMRRPAAFGIDDEGDLVADEVYEGQVGYQEIGGRGQCHWERHPLSIDDARTLRERYAAVVAQLDAEIAEAIGDG